MFASMLAAACAFPRNWGKILEASTAQQDIYPSVIGTAPLATSTRRFPKVTQSDQASSTATRANVPESTPSGGSNLDYPDTVIAHHNAHRANHSAPKITWDASLATTAQKIAESCTYAHDTYDYYSHRRALAHSAQHYRWRGLRPEHSCWNPG